MTIRPHDLYLTRVCVLVCVCISQLTATERTLCCVIENWQTPHGLVVPPALRPWTNGITFIPFRKVLAKGGKMVDANPMPPPLFALKSDQGDDAAVVCTRAQVIEEMLKQMHV